MLNSTYQNEHESKIHRNKQKAGIVDTIFSLLLASIIVGPNCSNFIGWSFLPQSLALPKQTLQQWREWWQKSQTDQQEWALPEGDVQIQNWINYPDLAGHSTLEHLQSIAMSHLLYADDGSELSALSSTRMTVFSRYRNSTKEIAPVLRRDDPMIRSHSYAKQAASKD